MNDNVKFIDTIGIPNEFVEQRIGQAKPMSGLRAKISGLKLRFSKMDMLDVFLVPIALCVAISVGFLVYQLTKINGTAANDLTGLIGSFLK